VVGDRNRSVVGWVAVIGAVSAQDVMDSFGLGRTVGYRRFGRSSTTSSRLGPEEVTTGATPHERAVSGNGRRPCCGNTSWSRDGAAGGVMIG
jgi:hypothetical protein